MTFGDHSTKIVICFLTVSKVLFIVLALFLLDINWRKYDQPPALNKSNCSTLPICIFHIWVFCQNSICLSWPILELYNLYGNVSYGELNRIILTAFMEISIMNIYLGEASLKITQKFGKFPIRRDTPTPLDDSDFLHFSDFQGKFRKFWNWENLDNRWRLKWIDALRRPIKVFSPLLFKW